VTIGTHVRVTSERGCQSPSPINDLDDYQMARYWPPASMTRPDRLQRSASLWVGPATVHQVLASQQKGEHGVVEK
jgi:hypothetical protein